MRTCGSIFPAAVLAATGLLFLACPMPYLERAIDPPGWSGTAGGAVGVCPVPGFDGPSSTGLSVNPVAGIRYCPSRFVSFAFSGQSPCWFEIGQSSGFDRAVPAVNLSVKGMLRPVAFKLGLNVYRVISAWDTSLAHVRAGADAALLYDPCRLATVGIGGFIGGYGSSMSPVYGFKAGVTLHCPISHRLTAHVSLADLNLLSGEAGFAFDWHRAQ